MPTVIETAGEVQFHGLIAEFDRPETLVAAAHRAFDAGYRNMDAYAPMPVSGLAEAIGFKNNTVSLIVLCFGILGAAGGFGLCWWMSVIAYPHNVAGRPLNSWPAYIPITFEGMVLIACLSAIIGMLALNGLPQPYHPVFNVPEFARASRDRFFLCIEATDPHFDPDATRRFLQDLNPDEVMDVPA